MNKQQELQKFKAELVAQMEKGNQENVRYFELNIARLAREIVAEERSAVCPKCGLPLVNGSCIDCD
jgi:hypothetical protein